MERTLKSHSSIIGKNGYSLEITFNEQNKVVKMVYSYDVPKLVYDFYSTGRIITFDRGRKVYGVGDERYIRNQKREKVRLVAL